VSLPRRLAPITSRPGGQQVTIAPDRRAEEFTLAIPDSDRREDYVATVTALWNRARDCFVAIGRALEQAKARLPHGEFERMVANDLPFNKSVAHQIRVAAAAVSSGRLPARQLPGNYTTIYHLATLDAEALSQAEKAGLFRPNLRRSEVIAFKRQFLRFNAARTEALIRERTLILRKQAELQERLAAIEVELSATEGRMGGHVIESLAKEPPTAAQ
jgi:hypothetical protein